MARTRGKSGEGNLFLRRGKHCARVTKNGVRRTFTLGTESLADARTALNDCLEATTQRPKEFTRLTDDEFGRLMNLGDWSCELCLMVLLSRLCGGLRTSDLHELQWVRIDWQARTWS